MIEIVLDTETTGLTPSTDKILKLRVLNLIITLPQVKSFIRL